MWNIDLVLLNIVMPGIDGFKVATVFKKVTAISFGEDGYVTKPFEQRGRALTNVTSRDRGLG